MNRSIVPGLLVLLFFSRAQAESRLRIGVSAGTVNLVSPERLPVAMSNYAERRATVVWFLSARYPTTAAAADSIVSLNQQYRHRRILFVGVFPDPAETRTEVHAFWQGHGFNFPVYLDLEKQTTRRFGAHVTPEAFLLDKQKRLLFRWAVAGLSAGLASVSADAPVVNVEAGTGGNTHRR